MGTIKPGIVAIQLVIATNVPAKFGAISMWLDKKPQYIPPMQVTPIVINITAKPRLHPTKDTPIKHTIGTNDAENVRNFIQLNSVNLIECK